MEERKAISLERRGKNVHGSFYCKAAAHLPAGVTDLATGLADVDGDAFAHDEVEVGVLTLP